MSLASIVEFINNNKSLCSALGHLVIGISGSWAYHFICVYRKEKEKIKFSHFFGYPFFLIFTTFLGALAGLAFFSTTLTRTSLVMAFIAGFSSVFILDKFGDKIIQRFGEFLDNIFSKNIVNDAHEKSDKLLEDLIKHIQELTEKVDDNTRIDKGSNRNKKKKNDESEGNDHEKT